MTGQTYYVGQNLEPGMFPVIDEVYRIDTKTERRWYVVQIAPRAERKATEEISKLGVTTYSPIRKYWGKRDKRTNKMPRKEGPLMPGYLFAELPERGAFGRVRECDGVYGYIEFQGEPAPIDQKWIDSLKMREEGGSFDETRRRKGIKVAGPFPDWIFATALVRIVQGPFATFIGSVIEAVQVGRVKVEVTIFGRATPVDLELAQIAPL